MKYNVRFFELVDYESLCELFRDIDEIHATKLPEFFNKPKGKARTLEFLQEILSDANSEILIAEFEKKIIGILHMEIRKSLFDPTKRMRRFVFLDALIVRNDFQGFGVGQLLLEEGIRWSKQKGIEEIEVDVWEFNSHALQYLEKRGFKTLSRRLHKKL